ncbi:MAG: portal protein [Pseudomonadota bacterium]
MEKSRAVIAEEANLKTTLDRYEEMKRVRQPWENIWREIGDYLLPRRNTDALEIPGAVRPRRVVDNTGVVAADRLASTLAGHLLSPFTPSFTPKLDDGEADREEALWFEHVSRRMFQHLSGSGSTFRVQMAESMLDAVTLGTNVTWIGGRQGALPSYQALHIMKCWIADDPETGRVDTLFRTFELPLWKAVDRYPLAEKLREEFEKPKAQRHRMVTFLHGVYPNQGGKRGAASHDKPYRDVTIVTDGDNPKIVVDAGGWDDFPFAVARFQRLSGQPYGYGPGIQALPLATACAAGCAALAAAPAWSSKACCCACASRWARRASSTALSINNASCTP